MSQDNSTEELYCQHAVRTDVGRRRSENQDAYGYLLGAKGSLFIVADGMGGAQGGSTASAVAVEVVSRLAANDQGVATAESLRRAIESANSTIFEFSRKEESLSGMGTTIVALAIHGTKGVIAHVGDSRIYRLRDGELTQLTRDHTLVQELIDSGAILPEQAENHPIAHMLTRSLGPAGAVDVEVRELPEAIKSGDIYLLCCDGLCNMVSDERIASILKENDAKTAVEVLVNEANQNGGTDNTTVEVIHVRPAAERDVQPAEALEVVRSDPPEALDLEQIAIQGVSPGTADKTSAPVQPTESVTTHSPADSLMRNESESRGGDAKATASTSALDTLLFGKHGEVLVKPKSRYEDILRAQAEEENKLEDIDLPDYEAEEVQQLQYMGFAALALVAVTAGVLVYTLAGPQTSSAPTLVASKQVQVASRTTEEVAHAANRLPSQPYVAEEPDDASTVEWAQDEKVSAPPQQRAIDSIPVALRTPVTQESIEFEELIPDEQGQAIARLVAEATMLSVPPPPQVIVRGGEPTEPIIWEHEAQRIVGIEGLISSGENPTLERTQENLILSDTEKLEITKRKTDIRDRIAILDARLRQLGISSKSEADQRIVELNDQSQLIDSALNYIRGNFDTAKRRMEVWEERAEMLTRGEHLSLASQVSLSSAPVRRRKEAYEIASVRYLDAVELWREDPSQDEVAARMATLGRELEARRVELEQAVVAAVERALEQAKFDVSEFALVRQDLERRQSRTNRQAGFLKGHTALNDTTRMEKQREFLQERTQLVEELRALQKKFSDEQELETRRKETLALLGLS